MITINTDTIAPFKAKFDEALAAFESKKGSYNELHKTYRELIDQTNAASQKAGELERARKAARIEAGGKITNAVIDIRKQHAETLLELEELEEAQTEIREGLDDMLPELNELASAAFRARQALAEAAAETLQERRNELVKELGQLLAFELKAKEQGTPFDLANWRRFGDGSRIEPEEMAAGKVHRELLNTIKGGGDSSRLLAEIGAVEIDHGPLERHRVGAPMANIKRARGRQ